MIERTLGKGGLRVSAVGLGCMGMSEFYDPSRMNDDESIRVIRRYLDLGGNFLDTADMYGSGRNEVLVGRAIAGRRAKVVLATKFGNVRGPKGEFLGVRGDAGYVRECCEASLLRLKVDVIDLYYQHRVDPAVPIEETIGAMAALVKEGKVRHLGMSEAAPGTLRRAASVHPIAALQTEYSLWSRDPEDVLLRTVRVQSIGELAKAKGCTPGQLALAWVLAQGTDIVPIPGTKRLRYLEENLGALDVRLSHGDLDRIDGVLPAGSTSGERYPAHSMQAVNR
jgi:aryl-alcohol dehydrogenase-like predicted oxidoreductase